jgi:uncharacterized protein with von Willebrand factor type A (vWA) domain
MSEPEQDVGWLDEGLGPEHNTGLAVSEGGAALPEELSDYCVKLDAWGKRRGTDMAEIKAMQDLSLNDADCADLFGMSFEVYPELHETDHCKNKDRHQFLEALQQDPNYEALHTQTRMDVVGSELAAAEFGKQFAVLKEKREKERKKDKNKGGEPTPEQQFKEEMEAMAAAGRAAQAATQEVQDLNDMRESLGAGTAESVGNQSGIPPDQVRKLFQKVKNDSSLKEIFDNVGRLMTLMRAKQRSKTIRGQDELAGITTGNDIGRALARELALASHPILRLDFMRRFAESQLQIRKYKGVQKVARGPIIFAVDESGSMAGTKYVQSKSLALCAAKLAQQQKRWFAFVSWSTRGRVTYKTIPPGQWNTLEVLQWVQSFQNGGGTHLPLEKLPEIYTACGAPEGKTDVVIVTDGETNPIDPQVMEAFGAWKRKAQCKLIGITIQSPAQYLRQVSDLFYEVKNLDVDNPAVAEVVSI